MKGSAIGGVLGGVTLGVAAVTAFNMMSRANQRKVRSFATRSGRVLSSKVNELFGK
jgi:ribosomal protein S1